MINVIRICEFCGEQFSAKTTTTKYCSLSCNRRAYKKNQRDKKIEISELRTQYVKREKVTHTDAEILTIAQAATLLGSTNRRCIERLIAAGKLKATRITPRKIRILRIDVLALFDNNIQLDREAFKNEDDDVLTAEHTKAMVDKLYTIDELKVLFSKKRDALYCYLRRNQYRMCQERKECALSQGRYRQAL